jgi:hypothetical protein
MTVSLRAEPAARVTDLNDDVASAFARNRDPGALTSGVYPGVGQ